jgi:predicted RNA-binding Zn ribbon-like protein
MQLRSTDEDRTVDLPEEIVLPLSTCAPYWYWLGGRPSLDLVNTLRERWRRGVETLCSPQDLASWLVEAGLMDAPTVRVPRAVLDDARTLREAIDTLVAAAVTGTPVPAEAVSVVDDWLVFAGERPALRLAEDGVPVLGERPAADSPRRALGVLALDAATMLGTPEGRSRVRICASDTCSARFYDRSPAGRRRWCSMRTCGNVAKARRHRARARGAS